MDGIAAGDEQAKESSNRPIVGAGNSTIDFTENDKRHLQGQSEISYEIKPNVEQTDQVQMLNGEKVNTIKVQSFFNDQTALSTPNSKPIIIHGYIMTSVVQHLKGSDHLLAIGTDRFKEVAQMKLAAGFTIRLDDFINQTPSNDISQPDRMAKVLAHEGGYIFAALVNPALDFAYKYLKGNPKHGHEEGNPSKQYSEDPKSINNQLIKKFFLK